MSTQNTPAPYSRHSSIHTSPWGFFTPSMLAVVAVVVMVCLWAQKSLLETFLHHVELNGIILGLTVYGVFRVYENNFHLYRTARFVRLIEQVEQSPKPDEAKINTIIRQLPRAGSLLDIQNTENALRRMATTGLFVISDNDSRLIKSKIGARVRYRYNHISFFAGILISFGLLGTFVGLIQTVGAVGEQMGAVSNSLATGHELSVIDLITGISKPLQGMGTAFGASLFGLGGSMLLGGLNHVGGHAQDHFMENLSRWLDDHIPNAKHETLKKAQQLGAVVPSLAGTTGGGADASSTFGAAPPPAQAGSTSAGMSMEMGTFLVLAEDTHKQLRALGGLLENIATALNRQQEGTQSLQQLHAQHAQQLQGLQKQLAGLPATGAQVVQAIGQWQSTFNSTLSEQARQLEKLQSGLATSNEKISSNLAQAFTAAIETQTRQISQIQGTAAPAAAKPAGSGGVMEMLFGKERR